MLRRLAASVCALTAALAAQAPAETPVWPVDLEAIAKKLEVTPLPAVIDHLPVDAADEIRKLGQKLSTGEVDNALTWTSRNRTVAIAAAVRVLAAPESERATAAGLQREIQACLVLGRVPGGGAIIEVMMDAGADKLRRDTAEPGLTRLRGLGARLLREHPSDPLVGKFLWRYDLDLGLSTADKRRCAERSLELLGASASAFDHLSACGRALADLDVAGAKRSFGAAVAAPMPECVAGRSSVAVGLFDGRDRIAEAERLLAAKADSPLEEKILRVRRLQVCDGTAAIEECRRLIADDVPHALPYSVLAAHETMQGNADAAAELLARACNRPGADFNTVVALGLCKFTPLMVRRSESDEQRRQIESDMAALLNTADEFLAGDLSEGARLFAWLRAEAVISHMFPHMSVEALGRGLPAARALQRQLPASLPVYMCMLAGARISGDDAAAREALRAPIPEALAGLDGVVRLRAEVMLQRVLVAGGDAMDADLERAFADLARVQQDPCEANYLRGVLQWSRGIRSGDNALLRRARDLFAAAQRPRSEAGWWRAASASCVANTVLGDEDGFGELLEQRWLRDEPKPHFGVTLITRLLLDTNMPAGSTEFAERAGAQQKGGVVAALRAATAAGRAARGDGDGAREAARLALRALDDLQPLDLAPDSGVACEGQFKWTLAFQNARASLKIELRCDHWILPKLPDRARLQALAEGK